MCVRVNVSVCVCVCLRQRERESVGVIVCVCVLSSQFISLLLSSLYECCSWCIEPTVLTIHR